MSWTQCELPDWYTPLKPELITECWVWPLSGRSKGERHGIYVFPSCQFEGMWAFIISAGANSDRSMSGLGSTKEQAMEESVARAHYKYAEYRAKNPYLKVGDRVRVDDYTPDLKDRLGQEGEVLIVEKRPQAWEYKVRFDDGATLYVLERVEGFNNLMRWN